MKGRHFFLKSLGCIYASLETEISFNPFKWIFLYREKMYSRRNLIKNLILYITEINRLLIEKKASLDENSIEKLKSEKLDIEIYVRELLEYLRLSVKEKIPFPEGLIEELITGKLDVEIYAKRLLDHLDPECSDSSFKLSANIKIELGLNNHPDGSCFREFIRTEDYGVIFYLLPKSVVSTWYSLKGTKKTFKLLSGSPLFIEFIDSADRCPARKQLTHAYNVTLETSKESEFDSHAIAYSSGDYSLVSCRYELAFDFNKFAIARKEDPNNFRKEENVNSQRYQSNPTLRGQMNPAAVASSSQQAQLECPTMTDIAQHSHLPFFRSISANESCTNSPGAPKFKGNR